MRCNLLVSLSKSQGVGHHVSTCAELTCRNVLIHVVVDSCVYVHVYKFYVDVYFCVFVCVHLETERDRTEIERRRERERERVFNPSLVGVAFLYADKQLFAHVHHFSCLREQRNRRANKLRRDG